MRGVGLYRAVPGDSRRSWLRYSEQISNGPTGSCGCFAMEGAAADVDWKIRHFAGEHEAALGVAADVGVKHTGNQNGASYGLTVKVLNVGPRFVFLPARKLHPFAQALFDFAHGSGSEFPEHGTLVGAADYALTKRLSVRLLQLDYLRTGRPNNSTNWQNNLRIGGGLTLHFAK